MRYLLNCNCQPDQSGVKRINNHLQCLDHPNSFVLKKIGWCAWCGTKFFRGTSGKLGFLCPPCGAENKIEISSKRVKKIAAERKKAKAAKKRNPPPPKYNLRKNLARGEYCKSILTCLAGNYPACLDCDSFYPLFRGVDPGSMEQFSV